MNQNCTAKKLQFHQKNGAQYKIINDIWHRHYVIKKRGEKDHCSAALFIVILQMATDDFAGPPKLMHIACVALIFLFFHVFSVVARKRLFVPKGKHRIYQPKKIVEKKRNTFWKHQIVKSSRRIDGKHEIISSQSSVFRWHIHSPRRIPTKHIYSDTVEISLYFHQINVCQFHSMPFDVVHPFSCIASFVCSHSRAIATAVSTRFSVEFCHLSFVGLQAVVAFYYYCHSSFFRNFFFSAVVSMLSSPVWETHKFMTFSVCT